MKTKKHHQKEEPVCKKYSPAAIANNFLWLAKKEGKRITPMKLVKLVYFAYGWALALLGRRVFDEQIQAWKHGPVIPSVYNEFKRFGGQSIDTFASDTHYNPDTGEITPSFPVVDTNDKDMLAIIGAIWNRYKSMSAWQLSQLTHEEGSPWAQASKKGYYQPLSDEDIAERCLEAIEEMYTK